MAIHFYPLKLIININLQGYALLEHHQNKKKKARHLELRSLRSTSNPAVEEEDLSGR